MEKPRLLQGFRDYLPHAMRRRRFVIEQASAIYERYGFEPLDTPALEYADLLTGKYGEDEKLIYQFEDRGGRKVALRYDLTVPLARVATTYPDLPNPFKRYQAGPVWRADSPQRGRFREFMQCDADTVGTESPLADAEMICMIADICDALGLAGQYEIRLSHRGVFSALLASLGISGEKATVTMRLIDKLAKLGQKETRAALQQTIDAKTVSQLFEILNMPGDESLLNHLTEQLASQKSGQEAVSNLAEIYALCQRCDPVIDLSIVRGLEYYTGIVYEVILKNDAAVGSIAAGGRYDSLMHDLAGTVMPAVGISLGVDRLIAALPASADDQGDIVVVAVFAGYEKEAFDLSEELRRAGINAALAFGSPKIGKQLQYADAIGARSVVLYGENEAAKGIILVRDMKTGTQTEITKEPSDELIAALQKLLH